MSDIIVWKIDQSQRALGRRLEESLYALLKKYGEGELTDNTRSFTEAPYVSYVMGHGEAELVGYATCEENTQADDIGLISHLSGFRQGVTLTDRRGNEVTRKTLHQFDGYAHYTGKGKLLYIAIMETFFPRKGLGTKLLDFIKAEEYELIELEANGPGQAIFFMKNGFIDTGLDSDGGNQTVMVWNNPKFLR